MNELNLTIAPQDQAKLKVCLNQIAPFSATVQKIMVLLTRQPVDIPLLSHTLSMDPILSASVLKLANSAFYGFPRKISNIKEACVLLGIHTIKQMVISFSLIKAFPAQSNKALDCNALWKHCIGVAVTAKLLARELGMDQEEAFTAGLLHDIGQFIINRCFSERYGAVIRYCNETPCSFSEAEQELLQLDHAQVGTLAIQHWRLADSIAEVTLRHHWPLAEGAEESPLVDLVHLADILAKGLWLSPAIDHYISPLSEAALHRLRLNWLEIEKLLPEIVSMSHEIVTQLLDGQS